MMTAVPTAKLMAAALAAFLVPILLGVIKTAFPDAPLPGDAGELLDYLVQGVIISLATLATGYVKSPASRDVVVAEPPPAVPPVAPPPAAGGGIPGA